MAVIILVVVREDQLIDRTGDPVTLGIPLIQGSVVDQKVILQDKEGRSIPLQVQPLAYWPDGSIKWLLLDFQVSVAAGKEKELHLCIGKGTDENKVSGLEIAEKKEAVTIDTGTACFKISTSEFKPFASVRCGEQDMLAPAGSSTTLQVIDGLKGVPLVNTWHWETKGCLRATLFMEGSFAVQGQEKQLSFYTRMTFYAGKSYSKIEFTLWNPHAARHSGGLWDLGDPGSIFFQDLSLNFHHMQSASSEITWRETINDQEKTTSDTLQIYQDSSGGENWQSLNHVNQNNEVCTSFRGYKVFVAGEEVMAGYRATPTISVGKENDGLAATVQDFWQNFPKALHADNETLTISLFPRQFNDQFELQGGERKTHTCFVNFYTDKNCTNGLQWVHAPLHARSTPERYAASLAVPWLIPELEDNEEDFRKLIYPAVQGDNTFFDRREIIDEYGWRNYGEWYADHEAVGYKGEHPLVSHYNNQYDGIYGTLCQYLKTGDKRWFLLGHQLSHHVCDIDIYHTSRDRPEYCNGLFWHTEHYIDAQTATHRCFSRRHGKERNLSHYGGGPALSHNYATGLLYHYFLTGEISSRQAVIELADFIENSLGTRNTLISFSIETIRKMKSMCSNMLKGQSLVDLTKVYSTDGPGRGGGNALSTLMTAYDLTGEKKYIASSERLIRNCVHPGDDIDKMDMLDPENRWMYTIFLQAVCKYLDSKRAKNACDQMFEYARHSLLHYARWMAKYEYLYLEKADLLEFPNETWAAQEIRKCTLFLYAALYGAPKERELFREKAAFFYHGTLQQLKSFETREHTRPITILLQNSLIFPYFTSRKDDEMPWFTGHSGKVDIKENTPARKKFRQFVSIINSFSIKNELKYIQWRLKK